jgi:hypothetical protein
MWSQNVTCLFACLLAGQFSTQVMLGCSTGTAELLVSIAQIACHVWLADLTTHPI